MGGLTNFVIYLFFWWFVATVIDIEDWEEFIEVLDISVVPIF